MSKCIAYIGTYSKGENGGIFRVEIDDQTGDLAVLDTLDVENPSHLALSPDGKGLENSMALNTLGQILQRLLGKNFSGLSGIGQNGLGRQKYHPSRLHIGF